ncbi:pectate lyase, partial [Wilcoxina mikolae CBS 423.85]
FPTANGTDTVVLSVPKQIYGVWDGMMKRYDRGVACTGQIEGLDKDAVFLVEDGATLKNVIIGANQIEGIHCMGSCTLENVWWEDVCEDALTIRQLSGTSTIKGGGAKNAQDKIIQFNGGGTVVVDGFYAYNFGKLVRSCGNCLAQVHNRHIVIKNVIGKNGKWLAAANENYGDTVDIQSACLVNVKKVCSAFDGNDTGAEPAEMSTG